MEKRNNAGNANKADSIIVTKEDIGRNIKKLRTALGFTQVQVAKRAKMSVSHFGQMEKGKVDSTVLTFFRISKALRIETYKLFVKE